MPLLTVSKLSKSYDTPLLRELSFTLEPGEGLAVEGPNGCGKSTLMDIVAGLIRQDGGSVAGRFRLGYAMQKDGLQEGLSCLDNLRLEAALCGLAGKTARERVAESIADCELQPFAAKKVRRCSAGMRGRLAMALSLLSRPDLLLLDEAFSALDQRSKERVKALLRERKEAGMAILMISHNREDFFGLCEAVIKLPSEEIVAL